MYERANRDGVEKRCGPNYVRHAPKRSSATTVEVMGSIADIHVKIKFVVDTGAHQALTQANAERG